MSTAPPRALQALIDQLSEGHHPSDAEITLLSDLDREDAARIRSKWGRIPDETRQFVLERAAELAEDSVELDFAALGRIGIEDADAAARLRAVEALAETTDVRDARRLRAIVAADPADEVRVLAAATLHQFVLAHELGKMDEAEGEAIASVLRHVFEDRSESQELRAAVLESLGPLSREWMPDLILEGYEGDEPVFRLAAVHAMGDSADDRWVEYLHDQFFSDDQEFRFEAVVAAGAIASEESVGPLIALLEDDNAEVLLAVVEALGEIGGQEAFEALEAFAERAPAGMEEIVKLAMENAAENTPGGIQSRDDDFDDGTEGDE